MTRMDHVMKIGQPGENPIIYVEEYAYTYLKRMQAAEKKKYYLYGQREEASEPRKLYIYGISDSAKGECTYFKEYNLLGYIKTLKEQKLLVDKKLGEIPLTGFFVFYSPNQAMQEYLVDTGMGRQEEKPNQYAASAKDLDRKIQEKRAAGKERKSAFPVGQDRTGYGILLGNLLFYAGCAAAVVLLAAAVTGGNGYEKLDQLRTMAVQAMAGEQAEEEEFIVEEQRLETGESQLTGEGYASLPEEETVAQEAPEAAPSSESIEALAVGEEAFLTVPEETVPAEETEAAQEEETGASEEYEAYLVEEGDTLAGLCIARYGSTERLEEICLYNGIEDEDFLAPGQTLYFPR